MGDAKMTKNLVISTVGTSILHNVLTPEERGDKWDRELNRVANLSREEMSQEANREIRAKIEELAGRARERLNTGNVATWRRLSAELNGLYGFYGDAPRFPAQDNHYLMATDTYQGDVTATILEEFIRSHGGAPVKLRIEKLSTSNTQAFSEGIKRLIDCCQETIPRYQADGYQVIFNLVGSFKALQGYMNTIGMFYADKIIYIFDGPSADLITIPHLPIDFNWEALRPYSVWLAMMGKGYLCPLTNLQGLAEALRDDDGTHAVLSTWGELVWAKVKDELLSDELLPFPRLEYSSQFREDFKKAEKTAKVRLQETLAKAATLLEESNGNLAKLRSDGGLQYETYENKRIDGKPVDHFRVSDGMRVTCQVKPDGVLVLRRFGEH